GALEGGARVCGDEAEVRICEATLSRTEEECHPTVRGVRAGESVLGAEKTVALGTGLARERRLLITGEPPKQAEDRKKPNPSACTGLAERLLPRRHGLIQSFPRRQSRRASDFPAIDATLNGTSVLLLRLGYFFICRKKIQAHKGLHAFGVCNFRAFSRLLSL